MTLSAVFEEFLARRQRMQKHFKPLLGGLLELAFFGGLVVGVAAVFLGRWYGALPLIAFLVGYGLLEKRREAALAAGKDEEIVRRQYDRLVFAMTAALAILGIWVFSGALGAKDAEGWVEPPPKTINLDLVTE